VASLYVAAEGPEAEHYVCKVAKLLGYAMNPEKHTGWSREALHLGVIHDMSRVSHDEITYVPKPGRVERLVELAQKAVDKADWSTRNVHTMMTTAEAASFKGKLTFLNTSSFGKVAKAGMSALSDMQYGKDRGDTFEHAVQAFEFYIAALPGLKPRTVPLSYNASQPTLIYTDAAWEVIEDEGQFFAKAGLGALIVYKRKMVALAGDLHQRHLADFECRATQIVMCEATVILDTVLQCIHLLVRGHLIIFCDNLSVVCSLVKGASTHRDINAVVCAIHLLLASVSCAWWVEWIDSESNPADGPSRDGLADEWCAQHGIPVEPLQDSGWQFLNWTTAVESFSSWSLDAEVSG
jgi:hypothetical protein